MTDLTTLADRVEAGTVEMQGLLIEEAFHTLNPEPENCGYGSPQWVAWDAHDQAFEDKMRAGAYVDAAMMLVPDRCFPGVSQSVHHGDWHAWMGVLREGEPDTIGDGRAFEPALALAAAAIRAHASEATNV